MPAPLFQLKVMSGTPPTPKADRAPSHTSWQEGGVPGPRKITPSGAGSVTLTETGQEMFCTTSVTITICGPPHADAHVWVGGPPLSQL